MGKSDTPEVEKIWRDWRENPEDQTLRDRMWTAAKPWVMEKKNTFAGGKANDTLDVKTKDLAFKAFRTWDPNKAGLRTHLGHQLRPLTREVHNVAQPLQMPQRAWWDMKNMERAQEELKSDLGRTPNARELADKSGLRPERIRDLRQVRQKGIPDSVLERNDPGATMGTRAREDNVSDEWPARAVWYGLGPEEKKVMELATGIWGSEKISQKEIAERLGLSTAKVSRVTSKMAEQLKEAEQLMRAQ